MVARTTAAPIIFLFAVAALPGASASENPLLWRPRPDQVHARDHRLAVPGGAPLRTIYFTPSGWSPNRQWPLLVSLPGSLANAERTVGRNPELLALAERHGFVLLVPSSNLAYSGDPVHEGRSSQNLHEEYLLRAIDEAVGLFRVDRDRIFLSGASRGGAGVWRVARHHPTLFQALALIAPASSPGPEELAAVAHLPILLVQGTADRAVSKGHNRAAVRDLRSLGADVRFIEISHAGHDLRSWPVQEWVFSFFASHDSAPDAR